MPSVAAKIRILKGIKSAAVLSAHLLQRTRRRRLRCAVSTYAGDLGKGCSSVLWHWGRLPVGSRTRTACNCAQNILCNLGNLLGLIMGRSED